VGGQGNCEFTKREEEGEREGGKEGRCKGKREGGEVE
jgi:hypothetical protein